MKPNLVKYSICENVGDVKNMTLHTMDPLLEELESVLRDPNNSVGMKRQQYERLKRREEEISTYRRQYLLVSIVALPPVAASFTLVNVLTLTGSFLASFVITAKEAYDGIPPETAPEEVQIYDEKVIILLHH